MSIVIVTFQGLQAGEDEGVEGRREKRAAEDPEVRPSAFVVD